MSSFGRKRKLLLVEDDSNFAHLLKNELESYEFVIKHILHGRDTAAVARLFKPDVILLDIHLCDTNGYEVVSFLEQDESTAEIPIVFLSGQDNDTNVVRALEKRTVYDFVSKKESSSVLVARIRHV